MNRREKLPEKCKCGAEMFRVHRKSPFIDDYADECMGVDGECSNAWVAYDKLDRRERNEAKKEAAQ